MKAAERAAIPQTVACTLGSSSAEKDMKAAERAAITRGRKQIVLMLGTVVTFFFACLLPFKVTNTLYVCTRQWLGFLDLELNIIIQRVQVDMENSGRYFPYLHSPAWV